MTHRAAKIPRVRGRKHHALVFGSLLLWAVAATPGIAQEALYQSRQVTPAGEYTFGIEGPAVDHAGNLYVVNFGKAGTIGKLAVGASQSELFAVLPAGSVGVAIRFDRAGRMFVADYKQHNILHREPGRKAGRNLVPFGRVQSAQRHDRRGRWHHLRQRPELEGT